MAVSSKVVCEVCIILKFIITIYVNAKNKKQALKMVKDVITKSNLIDKVSSEEEQYLYKVEEQQDGKE